MLTSTGTRSTELIDRICQLPVDGWDVLPRSNVMTSVGWLTAIEEAGTAKQEARYLLQREGGELSGAAVCYICKDRNTGLNPDHLLLGRLQLITRRLRLSFLPALVCAPYYGYGGHLLGRDPEALLDAVEDLAHYLKLPIHIPRVLDEDKRLCSLLATRGYHRTAQHPAACLDLEWDTFEGYVESLRRMGSKVTRTVRHEMKRFRATGMEIRQLDIGEADALAGHLHDIAQAHHRRLNHQSLPFGPAFLPRLKAALGERCALYGAFKGNRLTAFTIMLRDGRVGYLPFVGIGEEGQAGFTYFNLCYYRPIADAIEAGLERLFYGTLLYDLKVRRGCRVLPTSFYYRGIRPGRHLALAPWFGAHAWWATRFKFADALALANRFPAP